jgi:peptidoglycan/xylan/chitin deacetylase (PgdA/CDA1 family)
MNKTRYPREWAWPGEAKIAMTVNLALEAFRFRSQYTQEGRPGKVDYFSLSYAEYGARAGIWRILDFLDAVGLKGSMSTNGYAAELYPDAVRAVAEAGHELVGHGWQNDVLTDDEDPDKELEEIRRVTRAITQAGGVRPVGWTSPGSAGSKNTLTFLAQEGYLWNGDEANDDLPYVKVTPGGPMVLLPRVNMPHNDLSIWIQGKNPPSVIFEQFKDTFDQLYGEGENGSPKWIEIVLHAQFAGRPTLIPALRRCVDYAKQHDGVWFARKRDLAEWTLKREQPQAATADQVPAGSA